MLILLCNISVVCYRVKALTFSVIFLLLLLQLFLVLLHFPGSIVIGQWLFLVMENLHNYMLYYGYLVRQQKKLMN